jgi:hypothetical protein
MLKGNGRVVWFKNTACNYVKVSRIRSNRWAWLHEKEGVNGYANMLLARNTLILSGGEIRLRNATKLNKTKHSI